MVCAAKKGWKCSQEGLSGNLKGGKEQPFESGLGKIPGQSGLGEGSKAGQRA